MHFSIPFTQERVDSFGTPFVLYSLYLAGFPFCKVRYSRLRTWHEQLRRYFGSSVPSFPPKFYLAMTKPMAEERRSQLEQYLQNVGNNPTISSSEFFINYFKRLQMDTCKIQEQRVNLDIYLPNGKKMRLDVQTSDSAERVLEIVSHKLELHRELTGYFSLFLIQNSSTVLKRVVEFELPYVTLYNMKDTNLTLEIRKWYVDPSMDKMLFDSQAAVALLYLQETRWLMTGLHSHIFYGSRYKRFYLAPCLGIQGVLLLIGKEISVQVDRMKLDPLLKAVQEIEQQWSRPTHEQLEKLHSLEKQGNYIKFLELMQEVQLYSHIQLDPCTIDCLGPECEAAVSVGKDEIHCNIQLSNNTTKCITFKTTSIRCWQITFLGSEVQDQSRTNDQKLELRFEYGHGDSWKWITVFTKQAFLLSSCLQKMLTENLLKHTKAVVQMQIEVPPITKVKKSIITYDQMAVHIGKNTGNAQFVSEESESRHFVEIGEDDL